MRTETRTGNTTLWHTTLRRAAAALAAAGLGVVTVFSGAGPAQAVAGPTLVVTPIPGARPFDMATAFGNPPVYPWTVGWTGLPVPFDVGGGPQSDAVVAFVEIDGVGYMAQWTVGDFTTNLTLMVPLSLFGGDGTPASVSAYIAVNTPCATGPTPAFAYGDAFLLGTAPPPGGGVGPSGLTPNCFGPTNANAATYSTAGPLGGGPLTGLGDRAAAVGVELVGFVAATGLPLVFALLVIGSAVALAVRHVRRAES